MRSNKIILFLVILFFSNASHSNGCYDYDGSKSKGEYARGKTEGYLDGYKKGVIEGRTAGYNEGIGIGKFEGNKIGLTEGYSKGFRDGKTNCELKNKTTPFDEVLKDNPIAWFLGTLFAGFMAGIGTHKYLIKLNT